MVNRSLGAVAAPSLDGPGANGGVPMSFGRPVRAVSIGFAPGRSLEQVCELVDAEAAHGADIIALPEVFMGQTVSSAESLDGPAIRELSRIARKHRTYLVCPIDRIDATGRFNSAVFLDRAGEIAAVYDKIHPFGPSEWEHQPPASPGDRTVVFEADFGRVGVAICFDVNWPDLWQRLAQEGAELVIWPSAYSAGRALQAHAVQNHYYIMSATWIPDCRIYDLDGEQIVFDRNNRGGGLNVTRATLDLDRCIFNFALNDPGPLEALLRDHPGEIVVDRRLTAESWFVLKANRPGLSARRLAARYGLEELRDFIDRSRREIDQRRAGAVTSAFAATGTAPD
jgi:predicted amidohydrolase